jgi:tight adherence protein C
MAPAVLIAISGVFIAAALAAGSAASWWLTRSAPEHQRLLAVISGARLGLARRRHPLMESSDEQLARLTRLMPRSPKDMSRLQRRLTRAGFPHFKATVYYALAELVLPVVLGLAVLVPLGVRAGWMYALPAAAVGYALPGLYVSRKTKLRQKAIRNGLPDALDLLTVCVEAGSGLDQAIVKTSDELHIVHPELAEELRLITTEVRAGKPRIEAFKNFAKRTGVEDVRTLVAMLVQTDRFGTSIGQALRTHAQTARIQRRQRAEERAATVSVKLVFPLVLCLFPALYTVCFGPVVVEVYRGLISQ